MKRFLVWTACGVIGLAALTAWLDTPATPPRYSLQPTGLDDYAWQASIAAIKAFPALLVLLTCGWIASRIWLSLRYAQVDRAGLLPMSRQHLDESPHVAIGALLSYHQTELARAQHQVPERLSLNYAPRVSSTPAVAGMHAEEHTPAVDVPSFAELFQQGMLAADARLLLGYRLEDGTPIHGSRHDITALAIGGKSQTGKSTTTRYIAANLALQGCKFIVCDPHGRAAGTASEKNLASTLRPLEPAFLCAVAIDDAAIYTAVQLAYRIFDERRQGAPADFPVLLIIDEFSAVMRRAELAKLIMPLLEAFPTEAPKFDVSGLFLGQQWEPSRCGGTVFQRALGGAYLHRMHSDAARQLLGLHDPLLRTVGTLPAGQALLYRTNGSLDRVIVPNTTASDVQRVGYRVATMPAAIDATYAPADRPHGSHTVASGKPVSPEARHAAHLFLSGKQPAEIVLELHGVRSDQGRRYQVALTEVLDLVRQGVQA